MIKANRLYYPLILFILIAITGCIKVKDFTSDEIKWFSPYNKNDTVIFISTKGELDTMFFYKMFAQSDTVRSFERGFYNENYITVPYKLSKRSYHQFALMSDGKTRYDQDILSMTKTSDNLTTLEITFLGTIFNGITSIAARQHTSGWTRSEAKQLRILHLMSGQELPNSQMNEVLNGK